MTRAEAIHELAAPELMKQLEDDGTFITEMESE